MLPLYLLIALQTTPLPVRLPPVEVFTAKALSASDGDTLILERDNKKISVDLFGVDAPEIAQPFGREAQRFAAERVKNQEVRVQVRGRSANGTLVADVFLLATPVAPPPASPSAASSGTSGGGGGAPAFRPLDPTGTASDLPRSAGTAAGVDQTAPPPSPASPGETSLNRVLVDAGLAWPDPAAGKTEIDLQSARQAAQKAQRGLWSSKTAPVPPWQFRARRSR